MTINPLFTYFKKTVTEPLSRGASQVCCSVKSLSTRVYQVASAAISGFGNFPFYGVASSFGDRYSPVLGKVLGVSEVSSYFVFRIKNFDDIRKNFFPSDPEQALSRSERDLRAESRGMPQSSWCSRNWKTIASQTALTALGILAQFPLMVLVYYGNEENLVYPIIVGACEGSFTILSLIMSLKSFNTATSTEGADLELEDKRKLLTEQINCFLAELPSKYKDPEFVRRIEEIFSDDLPKTEDERGRALLDLVLEARGLPEIKRGSWDKVLSSAAKGLGLLIAGYQITLSGAVSYKGVIAWKEDQEALAVTAAALICLANLKILTELSMDSATSYYEGLRDIITKQYRPPLAHAVSPAAWYFGRAFSTALSWLSFGTVGLAARHYLPEGGTAVIVPAPLASALLLNDNLHAISDDILLWAGSQCSPNVKRLNHLNNSLLSFREKIQASPQESLGLFFSSLPNFGPRESLEIPADSADERTPLLEGRPVTA